MAQAASGFGGYSGAAISCRCDCAHLQRALRRGQLADAPAPAEFTRVSVDIQIYQGMGDMLNIWILLAHNCRRWG
jgi:hypothetical protein